MVDVSGISKAPMAHTWAWNNWDGPNQKWTLNPSNNTMTSVNSGLCLDVDHWRTDSAAPVLQAHCHGGGNQQWVIDNEQRLHPQHAPTKCLEVDQNALSSGRNGGRLYINDCASGKMNQKWSVRSAEK